MLNSILEYLKNRWAERSTHAGFAALAIAGLVLLFPKYADIIIQVAGALGIGVAIIPTSKK